jgi:hypothetical protein
LSVLAGLALLMSGCARTIAPEGWLPKPSEIQSQAFGGWMEIEYASETGMKTFQGELIAVQDNNVYLLSPLYGLVVAGIASASAESQSGFLRYPDTSWQEIAKFARFPQGIPKGLDLKKLEPKPLIRK